MKIIYNNRAGWYKIVNPEKFIPPIDSHMKSFNESTMSVQFKSSLELQSIRYCDANPHVVHWSIEPFHVKYIKPTDGKVHRYFIDLFIEFSSKDKFIVEVKSKGETIPPKKPQKNTQKAIMNYQKAIQTYSINSAKWLAATEFAIQNNMRFIILTEEQLR